MKTPLMNPELMDQDKYDEHKVKESAEILLEAEEIKKDEVLMKKIKEHWDNSSKKIKSLKQLREVASNFGSDDAEKDED